MSPGECAEDRAIHFSSISQEFSPFDPINLQPCVQHFLSSRDDASLPVLSEYDIYMKMLKGKNPKSSVKGDVHPKLMHAFFVEFVDPARIIFNSIIHTQKYPDQWSSVSQILSTPRS